MHFSGEKDHCTMNCDFVRDKYLQGHKMKILICSASLNLIIYTDWLAALLESGAFP